MKRAEKLVHENVLLVDQIKEIITDRSKDKIITNLSKSTVLTGETQNLPFLPNSKCLQVCFMRTSGIPQPFVRGVLEKRCTHPGDI